MDDTSIKEDKKLEVFLDRLEAGIKNKTFRQLNLRKFEKIKAELEKEFTEESVLNTISDISYSAASSSGTLIDQLVYYPMVY